MKEEDDASEIPVTEYFQRNNEEITGVFSLFACCVFESALAS